MPGCGGKLPQPRWTVRKGPTIAVSQASGSVLVTYANDPRKRLRVFDLNNPEETNATDVSIWRLDCATGTSESMPTLACPDDSGQCFVLDGILHVNCGASIVRWESTKSSWSTLVQRKNHQLQSPLVSMDSCIYALWRVPEIEISSCPAIRGVECARHRVWEPRSSSRRFSTNWRCAYRMMDTGLSPPGTTTFRDTGKLPQAQLPHLYC